MNLDLHVDKAPLRCPRCDSEALYRYGKTRHGKQRFRCLMCGRQFGDGAKDELKIRPSCPVCGKKMHIYRKGHSEVRFRCSAYPSCKTFEKIETGECEPLLSIVPMKSAADA